MNKVYVFNYALSSFSPVRLAGEGKLKGVLGVTNLPETLHPLLRQPVIAADAANPFEACRSRMERHLRLAGAKSDLLGWVIGPDKADEVVVVAESVDMDFYDKKGWLIRNYPAMREAHLEKVREECREAGFARGDDIVDMIRRAQPTVEYLEKQIQFNWLKPRLVDIDPDEAPVVLAGLYGRVLYDIETRVKRVTAEKNRMSTMISAAAEIVEKCEALAYIDKRYTSVAADIKAVLADIPNREKDSEYPPHERVAMMGLMMALANANQIDERIKGGRPIFDVGHVAPSLFPKEPARNAHAETVKAVEAHSAPQSQPAEVVAESVSHEIITDW